MRKGDKNKKKTDTPPKAAATGPPGKKSAGKTPSDNEKSLQDTLRELAKKDPEQVSKMIKLWLEEKY